MTKTIQQLREAINSGYGKYAVRGKNGKVEYYPAGAIQFRGKLYHGSHGGVHFTALQELLKHFPEDVLDKELTEKNFGFVFLEGPNKGKFITAGEQESDAAEIFNTDSKMKSIYTDKKDYIKYAAGK